jgi:hypothetical protein
MTDSCTVMLTKCMPCFLIVPQLGLGSELDKHLPTPVALPHTHSTHNSSSSSSSSNSAIANSSSGSHAPTRKSTQQPAAAAAAAAMSSCKSSTVKTSSSQSLGCETTEKGGKERVQIVPHSVSLGACHTAVLMYNSAIAGAPLCMLVRSETDFVTYIMPSSSVAQQRFLLYCCTIINTAHLLLAICADSYALYMFV